MVLFKRKKKRKKNKILMCVKQVDVNKYITGRKVSCSNFSLRSNMMSKRSRRRVGSKNNGASKQEDDSMPQNRCEDEQTNDDSEERNVQ